ncbi:MAG: type I-D CRISPR-associated helicase Cas3' [Anaerolineales bacterium]|nr:type I-D CRISPR-associated helicase Cas3' [Anaerolineales bacterium]
MRVKTLPVFSKLANEAEVPAALRARLPQGMRLSQHQVDTYRALTEGDAEVVFNTAMTGDGKSLAAYALALVDTNKHVFAMYPTNELLRDQSRQLEKYLELFRRSKRDVTFDDLWGAKLERLQDQIGARTRDVVLKERFENKNVILTNPDIFNLVMNYSYGQKTFIYTPQELPYSLGINFDYFLFDEFHIFKIPQFVAVMSAMLYLRAQIPGRNRFVFLSATPVDLLGELLICTGIPTKIIQSDYTDRYQEGYRQVLHPAKLHFYKLDERANAEIWIREHIDGILNFWKSCDGRAKGAIIVNSVATARRIARWLENELRPHHISVGENTGLTDETRRQDSLQKDIVVGTSTIDVGVDFNINFLFSSVVDGGTFLQRLGRLGRVRQGETPFPEYEAHALLSGRAPWIYARLEQKFQDGAEVERSRDLRNAIVEAFPQENDFRPYVKRWGVLHPAHVIEILLQRKDTYAPLAEILKANFEQAFDASFSKAHGRYWYVIKHEEKGKKLLDEVLAFRGSSPFQIACLDRTVNPPAFISYDLLSLVQNADFDVIDAEAYREAVEQDVPPEKRAEVLDALKYTLGYSARTRWLSKSTSFMKSEKDWFWVSAKSWEDPNYANRSRC